MKDTAKNVDEYIASFKGSTQEKLVQLRQLVKGTAPDAAEGISYGMPAYNLNKKPLVYFGGFEQHVGFYATPSGHEQFKKELSQYKHGKGSVQFPVDKPLPVGLIERIIRFRVQENSLL